MGNTIRLSLLLALVFGDVKAEEKHVLDDESFKGIRHILNCSDCHGFDGNSPDSRWPNLAGLNKQYILKQLHDFKAGRRSNSEMDDVVRDIPSDAILEELAEYFSSQTLTALKKENNNQKKQADLALGKEIFTGKRIEYGIPACAACHGKQGVSDKDGKYPSLAGQYRKYIIKQLKLFREKKRSNDVPAMMQNITRVMDDEDIESVAAYIETLSPTR